MKNYISHLLFGIVVMLNIVLGFSQNMIQNPGFENDKTKWNSFWSRDGVGEVAIINNPVHSGLKALSIDYQSIKDWSFQSADKFTVIPGQLYELSCWAKVDKVVDYANTSVILYDAQNKVLDWSYGECNFDRSTIGYKKFTTRFIIPTNIKYITPRLVGNDTCALYADDMELTLIDSPTLIGNYTLENEQLKAEIQLPTLGIKLTNKTSGLSYQTASSQFGIVKSVTDVSAITITVNVEMLDDAHSSVSIAFTAEGKALKMKILGNAAIALSANLEFPGIIPSQANDYMIIPRATGIIVPVSTLSYYVGFQPYAWKGTMPFVGITNLKNGYMVVSDDQWDADFKCNKPSGSHLYSVQLNQKPAKNQLGYNRTTYLVLVDNGYIEMCNWYRQHAEQLGYAKTFTQKKADNPNIDKLIGAVDFWPIRMNIKPIFLDSVKLMGMDKAIWNLTGGWGSPNYSVLIDSINSHGFLSDRYDIFTDVWPPEHPEWNGYRREGYPEDVMVDADNTLHKGWVAYASGQAFQGYYTCSDTHLVYAQKYVPADLAYNRYNSRFVDVELASNLQECFSTVHPITRKQDAEARNRLLNYIKNDLKLVTGVEEAHDFAFANADYGEGTMTIVPDNNAGYSWYDPLETVEQTYIDQNISPKLRIPLHGLVYHDVHIPTWYTGDGASKIPAYWDDKNLWNILYGTMPLFMPPSRTYWNNNTEKFISSYHLISGVTRNVGYAKMIDHQFITSDWNVQKTTFDNGWSVVANFDSLPRTWGNMTLAPKGFYASDGSSNEAFKLILGNAVVGGVRSGNRMFFNPFGTEYSWEGLRSTKSVFVEKFSNYLLLSFIGNQTYVDLNLTDLPFGISQISLVEEYFSKMPQLLTTINDGWKRLTRQAGKSYYKLYFKPITGIEVHQNSSSLFRFSPNPAQSQLNIELENTAGNLSILSISGKRLIHQPIMQDKIQLDITDLCKGIYFLKVVQNGKCEVRKFVKS